MTRQRPGHPPVKAEGRRRSPAEAARYARRRAIEHWHGGYPAGWNLPRAKVIEDWHEDSDGCMVRSVGDRAPAGEPQAPATGIAPDQEATQRPSQDVGEAFRELFGEPSPYPPPYGRSPGDISDL